MLNKLTAALFCGIILSAAGCAAPAASAPARPEASPVSEAAPVSEPAASKPESASAQAEAIPASEAAPESENSPASVVDPAQSEAEPEAAPVTEAASGQPSSLYRGVIEDFAVADDGSTVLLLRRPEGSDFAPTLKVKLTAETKSDSTQFGNGSFIEIAHSGSENADGTVTALTLTLLEPVEALNYNGKLTEIILDGDLSQLVTEPLGGGMPFSFNFGSETIFFTPLEQLKPGDMLNIYHSSMTTRSIPPQSPALEVRLYTEPLPEEAAIPAFSPEQ